MTTPNELSNAVPPSISFPALPSQALPNSTRETFQLASVTAQPPSREYAKSLLNYITVRRDMINSPEFQQMR